MTFYTYVLYSSKFDMFYYGQTSDLQARLIKHNLGLVKSTVRYLPWQICAYKEFIDRNGAFVCEKKLKNCKSRNRVQSFIAKNDFITCLKVIGTEN